jgi:hypothetical protein
MSNRFKSPMSTAALVISIIALFVAIGGVAGALPGKNTVNSGDVKKNSLRSGDLKNDGVTGTDVKESTLNIPASAVPKDTFGATVTPAGSVAVATLPGTTVDILGAGAYEVTFPRSVQGCVAVASTDQTAPSQADSETSITGPNKVFVASGTGVQNAHVIVVC